MLSARRSRMLAAILLSLPCSLIAAPVLAQAKTRVAVASFRALGDVSDAQKADLRSSLTGGLAASGLEVVPDAEKAQKLAAQPDLAGCQTPICLQKVGQLLGVPYLVQATDERVGAARYESTLSVIAAKDGRTVAQTQSVCAVCTGKEAGDDLSLAAAALANKLEQAIAPPPAPKPAVPQVPLVPTPTARGKLYRRIAIGAWAAAGASLVTGIALAAVDGNQSGTFSVDPTSHRIEVQRLSTMAGGATLIVLAPVLAVGGGVLWWRGKLADRKVEVSVAPGPGEVGMGARARW